MYIEHASKRGIKAPEGRHKTKSRIITNTIALVVALSEPHTLNRKLEPQRGKMYIEHDLKKEQKPQRGDTKSDKEKNRKQN